MTNIVVSLQAMTMNLVIGVHYDSIFNTVGAHDSASGTVAFRSVAILKPKSELCELT